MRRKRYKMLFIFLLLCAAYNFACVATVNQVSVKAEQFDKLKIKLVLVGNCNKVIEQMAQIIKKDLEFSGQFCVEVTHRAGPVERKQDITEHFQADCRLGIFLTKINRKTFGWRLYDLEYACMVKGEKYTLQAKELSGWGHTITDMIWPNLTGEKGFFSTKIVYSKKIDRGSKKAYKHIYVADYDGSNEKLLIGTPTVNVAPRWNNDPKRPLIFYSEHTNKNVRLMVADMRGRRKVASNFDGLNILSAFSPDGKRFAYCASRGDGYCQIYYFDGELKKLTNKGNNISPTFADNGDSLYFCSDANSKLPQIYKYDLTQKQDPAYIPEHLVKTGFEVSTAFSPEKNLLAYSKMVQGIMQIFVYNPKDNSHTQLTFKRGNKEECSWSPCGNYLLFSVKENNKSRLATFNLLTNNVTFVTSPQDFCCYPYWSPVYEEFPTVA